MVNKGLELTASFVEKGVLCRLCTKCREESYNIFVSNARSQKACYNVIQDLLNLEVSEGDGLPDTVCHQCFRTLMEFSVFKEMCVNSVIELKRNMLERSLEIDIKKEDVSSESPMEDETDTGEHVGQIVSQERAVNNVVCVPLQMGDQMYYYVVLAGGGCASIPSTWVDEEEGVYRWPRNVALRTAVSRQLEPDATWHKDTYDRILGPYDTEEQALEVESRMAQVSTKDEDHILWATQGNKEKRRRKRKRFDDMVELGSEDDDLLDELPPPPVGLMRSHGEHNDVAKSNQRPQCSEVHENSACKSGPSSVKINVKNNGIHTLPSPKKNLTSAAIHKAVDGDNQEGPLPSSIETDDVSGECDTADLIKREFKKLHARLDDIERKSETLSNKLDLVLAFLQNEGSGNYSGGQRSSLDALPSFPLISVGEIRTFEGKLQSDEQVQKQLMDNEARMLLGAETVCIAGSSKTQVEEDCWGNRQLPVECIGQLLEVHIKEEYEDTEDVSAEGLGSYSTAAEQELIAHDLEQVDRSSITRSIENRNEKLLYNLRVKKKGDQQIKVNQKTKYWYSPPDHSLTNDCTDQYQSTESKRDVDEESLKAKHYIVGTKTLYGTTTTDKGLELKHVEAHKNQLYGLAEYICNYCGFKCSDKTKLLIHITGHIVNKMKFNSEGPVKDISEKGISLKCNIPFKCEICGKEFSQKCSLLRHSHIHKSSKLFICDRCGKGFNRKSCLLRHSNVHTVSKSVICETCGQMFTHKGGLSRHSLIHTAPSVIHTASNAFKCETCGKEFSRKRALVTHLVRHTNLKPFSCETCGLQFYWKSDLSRHAVIHMDSKYFKCETCGKGFIRKRDLARHAVIHTGVKPFKCETCGKQFAVKSSLLQHQFIHTGVVPFKCEICSKGFYVKRDLLTHYVIHTGSYPFKCETCGKGFDRKSSLLRHIVIHTGAKLFTCDRCGKGFNRKSSLMRHSSVHTNSKSFKCETCGKVFTQKSVLSRHLVIHTGLVVFKCEICGRGFDQRKSMLAHAVTHPESKLFKCETCEKVYNRKSKLLTHTLIHLGAPGSTQSSENTVGRS